MRERERERRHKNQLHFIYFNYFATTIQKRIHLPKTDYKEIFLKKHTSYNII